jgi:transcriptional regulator with PAS, ATPase and Fis domain
MGVNWYTTEYEVNAMENRVEASVLPRLVNTPFEGVLAVDADGVIRFVNDFFARMLRSEPEELVGRHIDRVLPDCRLADTLVRGYSEWGDLLRIHGQEVYTARFPLKENGVLVGAMLKTVFPDLMVGRSIAERMMFSGGHTAPIPPTRNLFTCLSIVGETDSMLYVKKLARRASRTGSTLLITGESGTGKEIIAQAIHTRSVRRDAPFISVNCGAIPRELIEAELFGYESGAFTGARRGGSPGKFELANGGTLFMDEIGDMALSAQAKVLRALQENKITRVGGDKDIPVDARVVAATNKDIRHEIEVGNFREDLYHRLSVIEIHVPPLRERQGDIRLLVEHFINDICQQHDIKPKSIESNALELLANYPWTGNIRELHNVVERLIILSDERITADAVRQYYRS